MEVDQSSAAVHAIENIKPKRTRVEQDAGDGTIRTRKVLREPTVNQNVEVASAAEQKSGRKGRKFKQKTMKEFGHGAGRNKIRKNRILEEQTPNAEKITISQDPTVTVTFTKNTIGKVPTSRWGHTMCLAVNDVALLIGGQGDKQVFCKDSVWQLDLGEKLTDAVCWQNPSTTARAGGANKPESRMGHTAVYDPTLRCVYLYGGSKNLKWFSDIHMLCCDEWEWQVFNATGNAPTRAYHSATLFRHELWIFGGVYPQPDPDPDRCSNDIHVFDPADKNWYAPIVMGEKPRPRSGHSATLIDEQLVVFGGWDAPLPYNDLFILDLRTVEWREPEVVGKAPSPRSWHASCLLTNSRIAIHGGYNGDNTLADLFIFNLDHLSWTEVTFDALAARAGHTALCLPYTHEYNERDEMMFFGGGNNDGNFYNDVSSVLVPFRTRDEAVHDATE